MAEVLKIFVGAALLGNRVTCGDTLELEEMGKQKKDEGWRLHLNLSQAINTVRDTKAEEIHIAGGLAGVCVATIAREAADAGAKKIKIKRSDIRFGISDVPENFNGETLQIRESYLRAGLKEKANDKRIVIED